MSTAPSVPYSASTQEAVCSLCIVLKLEILSSIKHGFTYHDLSWLQKTDVTNHAGLTVKRTHGLTI